MSDPHHAGLLEARTVRTLMRAGWREFTRHPGTALSLYIQSLLYSALLWAGCFAGAVAALAPFYEQIVAKSAGTGIAVYTALVVYGMVVVLIFLEALLTAGTQYAFFKLVEGKERPTGRDVRAGFQRPAWKAFALSGGVVALPSLLALLLFGVLLLLWTRQPDYVLTRGQLATGGGLLALAVGTATLVAMASQVLVPIFVLGERRGARDSVRASWRAMEGQKRRWVLAMIAVGLLAAVVSWIPLFNVVAFLVARCWMLCTAAVLQLQILGSSVEARR